MLAVRALVPGTAAHLVARLSLNLAAPSEPSPSGLG